MSEKSSYLNFRGNFKIQNTAVYECPGIFWKNDFLHTLLINIIVLPNIIKINISILLLHLDGPY